MNFNDTLNSTFGGLDFIRPYWLLGIFVLIAFSLWRYQRSQFKQTSIIANHLSEHLVTLPETTKNNRLALNTLAIIACIALSGPSIRSVELPVYEMQKAQVIAFDLSYSMYATDIKPDRLSRAKYKAIDLLKQWTEGEKALIAYAGDAFTITPLTMDSSSIINHIPYLSPDLMPVRGSRPDLALQKAISLLKNAGYQQGQIVFITDGFDQTSLDKMQEMVNGSKWMVSVLAMATPKGAAIKLPEGGLLKDANGDIVIPKLEADTLYPVTQTSDGLYLTFDIKGKDISLLANNYNSQNLRKENSGSSKKTDNKQLIDDGYWLSLLLIPLFLLLFRKGVFYALLLSLTLPLSTPKVEASIWKNDQQNAYQAFQEKNYKQASEAFKTPDWKATALFKDKQYKQAEAAYLEQDTEQPNNANTLYNLGNAQAMQQKYEQALTNFNAALKINPNFKQAQTNKAAVEKLLQQKKQEQEKQQQNDQKNEQKNEQQSSEKEPSKQDQQSQQSEQDQQSEQSKQDQQSEQSKQDQQSEQSEQDQQSQQSEQDQQSEQSKQDQQSEQSKQDQQSEQSEQDQQSEQSKQDQQSEQSEQDQQSEQSEQDQQSEQSEQAASEQEAEKSAQQKAAASLANEQETNQEYEDLPIWLKNMPDDPSLLLRNKMQLEYRKRSANKPVLQKNNGEIW